MRKILAIGVAGIALLLILVLAGFGIMHTRYFTPSAQWIVQQLWPETLRFAKIEYLYPFKLRLSGVQIASEPTIELQQMDLWLNPYGLLEQQLEIDSVLIDGANLAHGLPAFTLPESVHLNQLALHNIDWADQGIIARGVSLQIKQPVWDSPQQQLPYGKIQLAADQITIDGEAFNQVLVDANYQAQDSTVYGFSFNWHDSPISGQAEQYPQGWSLINVTLSRLNLNLDEWRHHSLWQKIAPSIYHINSLDLLNSQLTLNGVAWENLNLSVEDYDLRHSVWQQQQAYLSLNADSAQWLATQWVEPSAELTLTPQGIELDGHSQVWQGDVQVRGHITETSLNLAQLTITGVKWIAEQPQDLLPFSQPLPAWQNLQIEHLDINNLQMIQTVNRPFWQASGLNADGKNLQWVKEGQWGFWQGQLSVTANSASYAGVLSTQGVLNMRSEQGVWQLTRAFLPLERGYVEAHAKWDLTSLSAPWQLSLDADSLPIGPLQSWFKLPFGLEALADISLTAQGIAGDRTMLAHSLDGQLQLNLRQGLLSLRSDNTLIIQPFELDDLAVSADRGRITITPTPLRGPNLNAQLGGSTDLLEPEQGQWQLTIQQAWADQCLGLSWDFQQAELVSQDCRSAP
ncbi:AsmA family protein [Vibrio cholerae]|uniref:AsmA family protein n=1 Tax=Vibrio cholerae TaxID=666 RepID=UPI000BA9478B|nr:AsmA family protein [Vibrio cholerae]EHU0384370.1 AsmA family protein [Vibrio cholerae]EJL6603932.1 AsmA family protein [Vibrio cholerae]EJL6621477.1 AsmA family protein [Vibrio cholerae]EJL6669325.1 AsmA family protein [Vibrio cholerae]EKF9123141.1 AsmA family protein [Vibrio cholerae]